MLQDYEIRKENTLMLAILKLLLSVTFIYLMFLVIPQFVEQVRTFQSEQQEGLKFRVVANSSSKEDQQVKSSVVESIQQFIHNEAQFSEHIHSYERVYEHIQKVYPQLNISMEVGENLFPAKYQFQQFYPQNRYESVQFVIGSGRGENWFCSVFPTVCKLPEDPQKERPPFYVYEWWKNKMKKSSQQNTK